MNQLYEKYNREERNLCSHLFRLLLMDHPNYGPLKEFVGDDSITGPRIFSEVALIRDAFNVRKNKSELIDRICKVIAKQEDLKDYRAYSKLPDDLHYESKTYPSFIRQKAMKLDIPLTLDELKLYGGIQGMFKAKPDLVICYKNKLLIYEAKFTLDFDEQQLVRTNRIGQVWQEILYEDLGFRSKPKIEVLKLGLDKFDPDVSWKDVYEIAKMYLTEGDITLKALSYAADWKS